MSVSPADMKILNNLADAIIRFQLQVVSPAINSINRINIVPREVIDLVSSSDEEEDMDDEPMDLYIPESDFGDDEDTDSDATVIEEPIRPPARRAVRPSDFVYRLLGEWNRPTRRDGSEWSAVPLEEEITMIQAYIGAHIPQEEALEILGSYLLNHWWPHYVNTNYSFYGSLICLSSYHGDCALAWRIICCFSVRLD